MVPDNGRKLDLLNGFVNRKNIPYGLKAELVKQQNDFAGPRMVIEVKPDAAKAKSPPARKFLMRYDFSNCARKGVRSAGSAKGSTAPGYFFKRDGRRPEDFREPP
jgi:hypothetical protein